MTSPSQSLPWSRRRLLAAAGAGSVAGLAGCTGGDDADDVVDPDDNGDEDSRSPHLVDHPVDEPLSFESDHYCGVCTMGVVNYPERNTQLAHENGEGIFFCSPGCLFAYYVAPDHFDGPDSPVASVWVTDFDTGELIDGFEAYYALERDELRADDPMKIDPRVYADEETALEYVRQYDDLSEEDVIGFEEVDEDIARIYRGTRLP